MIESCPTKCVRRNRLDRMFYIIFVMKVSSRFNRDMKTFSDGVESIGFKCTSCNTDMTHFATLTFKKTQSKAVTGKQKKSKVADISLAPCLYKKR